MMDGVVMWAEALQRGGVFRRHNAGEHPTPRDLTARCSGSLKPARWSGRPSPGRQKWLRLLVGGPV